MANPAAAIRATTSAEEASPVTSGTRPRRACLAASRAVDRHRASARSPRSPCHRATQRSAAQGTITSTPASVISSTASWPRSPFGMAWTTARAGSGAGSTVRCRTASSSRPRWARVTTHAASWPCAVGQVHPLPHGEPAHVGRVPSLRPVQHDQVAGQVRGVGEENRRLGAGATAAGSPAVEGVTQPGEESLLARGEAAGRGLLAAQRRQLLEQRLLRARPACIGVSTEMWMIRSPRPESFRCWTPSPYMRDDLPRLGTRADVQLARAVQGVDRQGGAQRRGHHRDGHGAVQVVALPLEDRVRALQDLQEEVTGRAAAGARSRPRRPAGCACRPRRRPECGPSSCAGSGPARRRRTRGRAGG